MHRFDPSTYIHPLLHPRNQTEGIWRKRGREPHIVCMWYVENLTKNHIFKYLSLFRRSLFSLICFLKVNIDFFVHYSTDLKIHGLFVHGSNGNLLYGQFIHLSIFSLMCTHICLCYMLSNLKNSTHF